jgi:hypothetical protein
MMQQITETASQLADTALADKPIYGDQTFSDGIDREKKTFKSHGAEQRWAVGYNKAWGCNFIAVQSQPCFGYGPYVSLSASDHDLLRPSRFQLKPLRQRSGYYSKSSAGVYKQLDFFATTCRTRQTCLYVKKSHLKYLFNTREHCSSQDKQSNNADQTKEGV